MRRNLYDRWNRKTSNRRTDRDLGIGKRTITNRTLTRIKTNEPTKQTTSYTNTEKRQTA